MRSAGSWLLASLLAFVLAWVPSSSFAAACKKYSISGQYASTSQAATCASYGAAALGGNYSSYEIVAGYICVAHGSYVDVQGNKKDVSASGDITEVDSADCPDDCQTKSKTVQSSGWYDVGTTQNAAVQIIGCTGGSCEVIYDGYSATSSALVAGVKHYYAQGAYIYTGASCTPGTGNAAPAGTETVPNDSCPTGSAQGTVNGAVVCAPSADTNTIPAGQNSTEKTTTETKADGSTVSTNVKSVRNTDGSITTTTTVTTTGTDGTVSTAVNAVTTGGTGGTAAGSDTSTSTDSGSDSTDATGCEANPSGSGCGGDGAAVGSLYDKAETQTWEQLLVANWQAMQATPIVVGLTGFFTVPGMGGSCPTVPLSIAYLKVSTEFDFQCSATGRTVLDVFKYCFLFVCAFFAFRLIAE